MQCLHEQPGCQQRGASWQNKVFVENNSAAIFSNFSDRSTLFLKKKNDDPVESCGSQSCRICDNVKDLVQLEPTCSHINAFQNHFFATDCILLLRPPGGVNKYILHSTVCMQLHMQTLYGRTYTHIITHTCINIYTHLFTYNDTQIQNAWTEKRTCTRTCMHTPTSHPFTAARVCAHTFNIVFGPLKHDSNGMRWRRAAAIHHAGLGVMWLPLSDFLSHGERASPQMFQQPPSTHVGYKR